MPDAKAIAAELRTAYDESWETGRRQVATYFADLVEVRHQPPLPQDGLKPGVQVEEESVAEFAAYKTLLSDFREETTVHADGDEVRCDVVLAGRTADGTEVRAPVRQILTVRDGVAVKTEVIIAPDVLTQLVEIVRAGGKPVDLA
jgi:ketosteroid isomerase-like protein